ncbi:MAG TPA: anthranilate synthase component I family protein, partial [Bacteroidia bacterium]|nr:anthranilate synthase component I family protein [Bacteroidia bacterium]
MQKSPVDKEIATGELNRMLALAAGNFDQACVLFHNSENEDEKKILAGFGANRSVRITEPGNALTALNPMLAANDSYLFGLLSYDLKNEIEELASRHENNIGFPALHFFDPEILVKKSFGSELFIQGERQKLQPAKRIAGAGPVIPWARTSKEKYLASANALLAHIQRGDIYEINYCLEFFAENVRIDPAEVYLRLCELTVAPFSALYKCGSSWLLCGSPERFLKKEGRKIFSQPIKGTRPRGKTPEEDALLKQELQNDPKERSENVMIVDLVRNDLSCIAAKGSVKVEELFGIHTFKTVHQMISTVSAELRPARSAIDVLRATFPMGSMTGAPKIRAMQLADQYEEM